MEPRRLVMGLAAATLLLAAALVAQAVRASPRVEAGIVRARAIELVDEAGRVRAQLNVEESGEAVLRLRDSKGQVRVKLEAASDGSGLLLLDGATEPGIHMLANSSGTSVSLTNKNGQRRVIQP